jgi:hypothetical protein
VRLGEWAVIGALAVAISLLVRAVWPRPARATGGSLLGVASGAALVAIVLGRSLDELARLPSLIVARPTAMIVALATIAVAVALVDFAFFRGLPLLARLLGKAGVPPELRRDAAFAMLSLGLTILTLVAVVRLDHLVSTTNGGPPIGGTPGEATPGAEPEGSSALAAVRVFDLPGQAMAIAMRSDRDGYVALDSGQVLAFRLPEDAGGNIELATALEGLDHPRGVALREDRLYVVERGPLPCAPEVVLCDAAQVNPRSGLDGEVQILSTARARVRAFDVGADGTLAGGDLVLADLPVVDALHAANAITVGPDGLLYLPVGNVDKLFRAPERANSLTPHPEWLGTVLRFDGSGAPPEIYAKGLRNVYQVAFDDQGRLWGVDNDGPAMDGWRAEELLQIKEGRNYGFPFEGTFGPKTVRDDFGVWISRHKGSAGAAWTDRVGLGPGLLSGSEGALSLLAAGFTDDLWTAGNSEYAEQDLLDVPGALTSIQVLSPDTILASLYGAGPTGSLYLIRFR